MSLNKNEIIKALINENEHYVLKSLESYIKKNKKNIKLCLCEECILDIIAIALNNLSPRYRLICRHMHKDSKTIIKIKKQVDIVVKDAIKFVLKSPHHFKK